MLDSPALMRVVKTIGSPVDSVFASAFYDHLSRGGSECEAIGAAWRKVRAEYRRSDSGVWSKREMPPGPDEEEDCRYECSACGTEQPRCACRTCGKRGPGVFCFRCGGPMRTGACPGCRAPWDPDAVERRTDPNAGPGEVAAVIPVQIIELSDAQVRFAGKGVIRAWASSNTKDQHGSIISQPQILEKIVPGVTLVDEEHNEIAVPGVRIAEVSAAQRNIDGRMVDGVSLTIVCDMANKAARAFYQKFVDGVYRGLSIMFYAPRAVLDAFNRGETDRIDQINRIPLVTATANPSNLGAEVLEIRSMKAQRRDEPTTEHPKAPDNPLDKAAADSTVPTNVESDQVVVKEEVTDIKDLVNKGLEALDKESGEKSAPEQEAPKEPTQEAAPVDAPVVEQKPVEEPAPTPEGTPTEEPPVSRAQVEELSKRVNSQAELIASLTATVQALKASQGSVETAAARSAENTASLEKAHRTIANIAAQQSNIIESLPEMFVNERKAARAYTDEKAKETVNSLKAVQERKLDPGLNAEAEAARSEEKTNASIKALKAEQDKLNEQSRILGMFSRTH